MTTTVSSRFFDEIKRSHTTWQYVTVKSPSGQTMTLHVVDGTVNIDKNAQYRRASTMTAIDPTGTQIPKNASDILTPFGTECTPYKGVRYSDGTTEVVPLGVFRLSRATVTESASLSSQYKGLSVYMEMYDRSRTISRNKFVNVYNIASGTNVVTAIKMIVQLTFPDAQFDVLDTHLTVPAPLVYNAGDDPWKACLDLASTAACDVYFDRYGTCVIAPIPEISAHSTPKFSYVEGQGCAMTDLATIYTDDPGYNGVIVTGSSTGSTAPPVQAVAWDTEPSSPTYYLGPYGRVPTFITDSAITTVADAQAEANAVLQSLLGNAVQLQVTGWANPALEVGDLIRVQRTPMNVNGLYVVDSFNVPFKNSDAQNIVMRTTQAVG